MEQIINLIKTYALDFGYRLTGAILALIIGLWIIKKFVAAVAKVMHEEEEEELLASGEDTSEENQENQENNNENQE